MSDTRRLWTPEVVRVTALEHKVRDLESRLARFLTLSGGSITGDLAVSGLLTAGSLGLEIASVAATVAPTSYPEGMSWHLISSDSSWPISTGIVKTFVTGAGGGGWRIIQTVYSKSDTSAMTRRSSDGSTWGSWYHAYPAYFLGVRSSNQTLAHNTPTTVQYTATGGGLIGTESAGTVTLTYPGTYDIDGMANFSTYAATGDRYLRLLHNGSDVGYQKEANHGIGYVDSVSGQIVAAAGDTVKMETYQSNGASEVIGTLARLIITARSHPVW